MATYDKLDWHLESAVSAGQPSANAFTHIGFYLAWLIRRDLHNPTSLPSEHVRAIKDGEMTGTDIADDIDTKLVAQVMTAEGRAFSDARYGAYTTEYEKLFKELPDYAVADNEANYERVERLLDGMYAEWVAAGRPKSAPEPPLDSDFGVPTSVSVMLPPEYFEEQLAEVRAPWNASEVTVLRPPTEADMPHIAPDLEALIPRDLAMPRLEVSSTRATEWGSSLVNRALKKLATRPNDAFVVHGLGGDGEQTVTVTIYGVPGASAALLAREFQSVFPRLPGTKWQEREIGGKVVTWASGREFTQAYWTLDGMVVSVAGEAARVERAIPRLP